MESTTPAAEVAATDVESRSRLQHPRRVLGLGLLVGALFDLLFWGQRPGISAPLFVLGVVMVVGVTGRFESRPIRRSALWLLPLLLACAAFIALRVNSFLTFLNVVTALALLAFLLHYCAAGDWRDLTGTFLVGIPAWVTLNAAIDGARLLRHVPWRTPERRRWMPLLRGLLLLLPLLLLFGGILASGDQIFAGWLGQMLSWLRLEKLAELGVRSLLIGFIGVGTAGVLAFSMHRGATPDASDRTLIQLPLGLGYVEAVVVMIGVNLLFGLFVAVQFAYLFGGVSNIAPEQFSYAGYARRGFAEIVVVSVLSLGVLLLLHHLTWRDTKRQLLAFNFLGSLQIGFLLVMLLSAAQRLLLYEQAFGLTHRRLYSHVFMGWLGLLLLWLVVVLWRRPAQFYAGVLVCGVGFVITLNLLNPDALIARVNVARYGMTFEEEAEPAGSARVTADPYTPSRSVDAVFLTRLSDDAVPALVDTLDELPPAARETVVAELLDRQARYEDSNSRWPSFHWSRWRAARTLSHWHTASAAP